MPDQIHEIDPDKIKIFVHRERDPAAHQLAILDTKRRGQIEPGEVRDIRHLPKEERKRPDGKIADYWLITGEGRLQRAKALGFKFKAFVRKMSEMDSLGRTVGENHNRVPMSGKEKAALIHLQIKAGRTIEQIAEANSSTVEHIMKLKRIYDKAAPELKDEVAEMAINDSEVLTARPPAEQLIIMEQFHETKPASIRELVKFAKRVAEETGEELSRTALKKSLARLDEDLRRMRDNSKVTRLHWGLSVQNLKLLLEKPSFRKAVMAEGINVAKFEKITSES